MDTEESVEFPLLFNVFDYDGSMFVAHFLVVETIVKRRLKLILLRLSFVNNQFSIMTTCLTYRLSTRPVPRTDSAAAYIRIWIFFFSKNIQKWGGDFH